MASVNHFEVCNLYVIPLEKLHALSMSVSCAHCFFASAEALKGGHWMVTLLWAVIVLNFVSAVFVFVLREKYLPIERRAMGYPEKSVPLRTWGLWTGLAVLCVLAMRDVLAGDVPAFTTVFVVLFSGWMCVKWVFFLMVRTLAYSLVIQDWRWIFFRRAAMGLGALAALLYR